MLKLQSTIDEAQARVGNGRSMNCDEGFSPPVHEQPLDIAILSGSILNGRGASPTQGKAARQTIIAADQAGAAAPASVESSPHVHKRRRKVAIVVAVSIEDQAAGNGLRRWLDKLLAITQDNFVLALIRDRRGPARRFLLTLRAALGATEDGFRFETSDERIAWGDAAVSAAALGASAGQHDQMDAALWPRRELAFYPRAVTALREAAQEAGFAWHVVCRAKAIAGVDGRREGWGPNGRYFWFLERDGQERAEDASFWEDRADRAERTNDKFHPWLNFLVRLTPNDYGMTLT